MEDAYGAQKYPCMEFIVFWEIVYKIIFHRVKVKFDNLRDYFESKF